MLLPVVEGSGSEYYLVHTISSVTHQPFKALESLVDHNRLTCGGSFSRSAATAEASWRRHHCALKGEHFSQRFKKYLARITLD